MKRRKWDAHIKAKIVIEGLSGRPVGDLCAEYRIRPSQYYKWRDHLVQNCRCVFVPAVRSRKDSELEAENENLKKLVGELTLTLNLGGGTK